MIPFSQPTKRSHSISRRRFYNMHFFLQFIFFLHTCNYRWIIATARENKFLKYIHLVKYTHIFLHAKRIYDGGRHNENIQTTNFKISRICYASVCASVN